ncbi:DegT/DnrJ/EryC1/StrS family aminotransferase [Streptomyces sp. NPDC088354]|uniref:DegT/DnrJ/EryC1/StrS family aminotransferase n=1 Tax=unclassified Streptomyces TaxID=2593676 RepID=UPI0029BAF702|nr:DegT/DnrJ/EryC1/StrS family aminotransferase [Streptomyces sp. MI02-7b]MDX3072543.1 DegT/DnrJ/EryC1/StrS family aminotransferase [Streptomyces sp. MI02-7b]
MQQFLEQGAEVAALEDEFSSAVDDRHAVAVDSATSALRLALLSLGIGAGEEVILPSFAPVETADAVRLVGAVPVFADIDPLTFCLDPEAVAAAITPLTVAILPVHLFGHPAAVDQLADLAARHGLAIVEDATQAQAATLAGRRVGTYGALSVFALADGAVVTTEHPELASCVKRLRDGAHTAARLADNRAAGGRAALRALEGSVARQRAHCRYLDSALTGVLVPYVEPGAHHVYHRYTVRIPGNGRPDRDAFAMALASRGVRADVSIPTPLHRLPKYRSRSFLPRTEAASGETLSLPVHPGLTEKELRRMVEACNTLGGLL